MSINQNNYSKHLFFMNLALMQANKNLGNTKTNPSVGCVIVKNGCVINGGCTGINGRPHAESFALSKSESFNKKSDLYVTLEPCSHYGKTPPCVKKIIKNRINKVYFSLEDPDLRSYGKSTKILKKNKISVEKGILNSKLKKFYKSYLNYKKKSLPFVSAKIAVSKDFYTINKRNKWITNSYSRARVHLMRAKHDCILTSINTIISDNSLLTCRIPGLEKKSPTRVILDRNLRIPVKSKIIKTSKKIKTLIVYSSGNRKKIHMLKKSKVVLIKMKNNVNKNFDLKEVLLKLRLLGFSRIFLESGLKLMTSFLNEKLVNDFYLFISRENLKTKGKSSFKSNKRYFTNKKNTIIKANLFGDKLIYYKFK